MAIEELEADAARMSAQDKAWILLAKGLIDDGQHRAWQSMPIGMFYRNPAKLDTLARWLPRSAKGKANRKRGAGYPGMGG